MTSSEFGTTLVKRLIWGIHKGKPPAQMTWDRQISRLCRDIASSDDEGDHDFRPKIKDCNTGQYMLIDTGACVSVFPKHLCPTAKLQKHSGLKAVNGTQIPSYGQQTINIRLNKKTICPHLHSRPNRTNYFRLGLSREIQI